MNGVRSELVEFGIGLTSMESKIGRMNPKEDLGKNWKQDFAGHERYWKKVHLKSTK